MAQRPDRIDVAALAALRPGMPAERLADAIGPSWHPPAAHKGGVVDLLQASHGTAVRLADDETIGEIRFDWRFTGAVEGVRMGMTLAEVAAVLPDLAIGADRPSMPGVRDGRRTLPDGVAMSVTFTLEQVNGIALSAPEARFHAPGSPRYPAPAGPAGAPFADPNLKLAVLSALMRAGRLDLGTPPALAAHLLGRAVAPEEMSNGPLPQVVDYLAGYPLTDALMSEVRAVVFDAGEPIYRFCWPDWDGEDGRFDVTDLAGIEHCPDIESITAIAMLDVLDVALLTPLRRLRTLSVVTRLRNPHALLDLTSLQELSVTDAEADAQAAIAAHPFRATLERLRARGVAVRIAPLSATRAAPAHPFRAG